MTFLNSSFFLILVEKRKEKMIVGNLMHIKRDKDMNNEREHQKSILGKRQKILILGKEMFMFRVKMFFQNYCNIKLF